MIEHTERTFVSYCSQRSHIAVAVFIPICGKISWKGNNSRIIIVIVLRKGLVHDISKFLIRLQIGGRLHHGIGVATSAHQGAFMRKN